MKRRPLIGKVNISFTTDSWKNIKKSVPHLKLGGESFSSTNNTIKDDVAIIIAYRNRDYHLKIFLGHIHQILLRQGIHYRIFVISQDDDRKFNRAMLFNVGFVEALKLGHWSCFIFHDVDLLPENDHNTYNCSIMPKHMSVAVDTMKYKLPYDEIFGGE